MKKALDYLYRMKEANEQVGQEPINIIEAIEELEAYITNYQEISRRLDNTFTTMAAIQNDNRSLVKVLDKMGKEINDLKKENQDLKESK